MLRRSSHRQADAEQQAAAPPVMTSLLEFQMNCVQNSRTLIHFERAFGVQALVSDRQVHARKVQHFSRLLLQGAKAHVDEMAAVEAATVSTATPPPGDGSQPLERFRSTVDGVRRRSMDAGGFSVVARRLAQAAKLKGVESPRSSSPAPRPRRQSMADLTSRLVSAFTAGPAAVMKSAQAQGVKAVKAATTAAAAGNTGAAVARSKPPRAPTPTPKPTVGTGFFAPSSNSQGSPTANVNLNMRALAKDKHFENVVKQMDKAEPKQLEAVIVTLRQDQESQEAAAQKAMASASPHSASNASGSTQNGGSGSPGSVPPSPGVLRACTGGVCVPHCARSPLVLSAAGARLRVTADIGTRAAVAVATQVHAKKVRTKLHEQRDALRRANLDAKIAIGSAFPGKQAALSQSREQRRTQRLRAEAAIAEQVEALAKSREAAKADASDSDDDGADYLRVDNHPALRAFDSFVVGSGGVTPASKAATADASSATFSETTVAALMKRSNPVAELIAPAGVSPVKRRNSKSSTHGILERLSTGSRRSSIHKHVASQAKRAALIATASMIERQQASAPGLDGSGLDDIGEAVVEEGEPAQPLLNAHKLGTRAPSELRPEEAMGGQSQPTLAAVKRRALLEEKLAKLRLEDAQEAQVPGTPTRGNLQPHSTPPPQLSSPLVRPRTRGVKSRPTLIKHKVQPQHGDINQYIDPKARTRQELAAVQRPSTPLWHDISATPPVSTVRKLLPSRGNRRVGMAASLSTPSFRRRPTTRGVVTGSRALSSRAARRTRQVATPMPRARRRGVGGRPLTMGGNASPSGGTQSCQYRPNTSLLSRESSLWSEQRSTQRVANYMSRHQQSRRGSKGPVATDTILWVGRNNSGTPSHERYGVRTAAQSDGRVGYRDSVLSRATSALGDVRAGSNQADGITPWRSPGSLVGDSVILEDPSAAAAPLVVYDTSERMSPRSLAQYRVWLSMQQRDKEAASKLDLGLSRMDAQRRRLQRVYEGISDEEAVAELKAAKARDKAAYEARVKALRAEEARREREGIVHQLHRQSFRP